jgi:hypothetical protein
MNDAMEKNYLDNDALRCPVCDDPDAIESLEMEFNQSTLNQITQERQCGSCGAKWVDCFELSFAELLN